MDKEKTQEMVGKITTKACELFCFGREKFEALSQRNKMIVCVSAGVLFLFCVHGLFASSGPVSMAEEVVRKGMECRREGFDLLRLHDFKVESAELKELEDGSYDLVGKIRYLPSEKYYREGLRLGRNFGDVFFEYNDYVKGYGFNSKKDFDKLNQLVREWNGVEMRCFRELEESDFESHFTQELEFPLDKDKKPRMRDGGDYGVFIEIGFYDVCPRSRLVEYSRAKNPTILLCDTKDIPFSAKGKKCLERYQKENDELWNIRDRWYKTLGPECGLSHDEKAKVLKKCYNRAYEILRDIPPKDCIL